MKREIGSRLRGSSRILAIKLRYVGDCIWALPFLENLKENVPAASITVVANEGSEGIFLTNSYVDRVITYPHREIKGGGMAGALAFLRFLREVRSVRADAAIELTDSDKAAAIAFLSGARTRAGFHTKLRPRHRLLNHLVPITSHHWVPINLEFLSGLGLRVFHQEIHNSTPRSAFDSLALKCPAVTGKGTRKMVLVHPGARVALRQWGSGNFARLCDLLSGQFSVFLAAGPGERALLDEVVSAMKSTPAFASSELNLQEFAALSASCDLFVGNDSGPIHIAATKTFVVGIYGPNSDALAGPWTSRKYVFEDASLSCKTTCSHLQCTNEEFHACMVGITPDLVFEKITQILLPAEAMASVRDPKEPI